MYHLNGTHFYDDELDKTTEFVTKVMFVRRDSDGTLWAMDKEGDEFEVLKEDLTEISK